MIQTMDLTKGMNTCSGGAEVKEGIGRIEPHSFPREPSGGSTSSGGNSLDGQSECSSWHSNQMSVSREHGHLGQTGRGFRVKVNLPTFKDKKAKDAMTYCSWQ